MRYTLWRVKAVQQVRIQSSELAVQGKGADRIARLFLDIILHAHYVQCDIWQKDSWSASKPDNCFDCLLRDLLHLEHHCVVGRLGRDPMLFQHANSICEQHTLLRGVGGGLNVLFGSRQHLHLRVLPVDDDHAELLPLYWSLPDVQGALLPDRETKEGVLFSEFHRIPHWCSILQEYHPYWPRSQC